ncbi:MAG: DUF6576 domain-containing protein [Planctomycetota bacterium]
MGLGQPPLGGDRAEVPVLPGAEDAGGEVPNQAELDRVLEKIAEGGMASLSRRELRFLKAETARRRDG